jgi:ABC-type nickel/cobalt efflux system permease component RcnA
MKYLMNLFVLGLCIISISCAALREKKAEKHQPFGPHKSKKMHKKKHHDQHHAHPDQHHHH